MKKMKKILSLCLVAVMLCTMLTACGGPSKEDVIGTWSGSYIYNGNEFSQAFVLNPDGTYAKATTKNGELSSTETGDYEIDGSDVVLYDSSSLTYHGDAIRYEYKDGVLINADHKFMKVE